MCSITLVLEFGNYYFFFITQVALAEHAADDLRLQTPLGNNEDKSEPTTPPPQEPSKVSNHLRCVCRPVICLSLFASETS
jgi:hypothetical protein